MHLCGGFAGPERYSEGPWTLATELAYRCNTDHSPAAADYRTLAGHAEDRLVGGIHLECHCKVEPGLEGGTVLLEDLAGTVLALGEGPAAAVGSTRAPRGMQVVHGCYWYLLEEPADNTLVRRVEEFAVDYSDLVEVAGIDLDLVEVAGIALD